MLQPLTLSLQIASCSTLICLLVGVPMAFLFSRKKFVGKSFVETLLILPLVLPPTVVGYLIILAMGVRSPIGSWLDRAIGYRVLFSFGGAVLATVIVSLPLLLLPTRAAFAAIDSDLVENARLLGTNTWQLFWNVYLPLTRRGIATGALLAFARSLGEFGASIMVFGAQQNRLTLPISIYEDFASNEFSHAWPAVAVLTLISLAVILVYNRWPFQEK